MKFKKVELITNLDSVTFWRLILIPLFDDWNLYVTHSQRTTIFLTSHCVLSHFLDLEVELQNSNLHFCDLDVCSNRVLRLFISPLPIMKFKQRISNSEVFLSHFSSVNICWVFSKIMRYATDIDVNIECVSKCDPKISNKEFLNSTD